MGGSTVSVSFRAMNALVRTLRRRSTLVLMGVGTVLNMVAFQIEPYPHTRGTSTTILDLQFAGTADRFAEVLATWVSVNGIEAIANAAKTIARLDYTFPVLYGVFFASALAWFWASDDSPTWGRWLVLIPLIAGLFDMAENSLHLVVLADLPPVDPVAINDGAVAWATRFATVKYSLLVVALLLIVAGAVRRRVSRGSSQE